jgi:hypothetical protein
MRRSVSAADEQVAHPIVLVFTENDEALVSAWVKRVCDSDFACQNSGIMNCLLIPAGTCRLVLHPDRHRQTEWA